MNRRRFLLGLAGAGAALARRASAQGGAAVARLSVDYEDAGRPIARDFIGLSYESAVVAANDFFTADNRALLRLLRTLGHEGVLRIGGNTSERTLWRTQDTPAPRENFVVTPLAIDRLAGFLRALGWRLIYGLNLAAGTPEEAAAEAAYVAQASGPQLLAFQIGNEPDGFGRWSGARPKTYDVSAFLNEWRRFRAAIVAAVPHPRFAGPDVAAETSWIGPFADDAAGTGLVMLTRHYYADGPASNPAVTLGRLMRSAGRIAPTLAELAGIGTARRLPWRIAETNSVYAGGRPGVSDTLGAALWGAELMFQIAAAGGAGVNFHAGEDKIYTPISHGRGGGLTARALYYGMLMFAQAQGDLVPATLDAGGVQLAAYAVRGADGALRVVVINKDVRTASLRILGRRFARGEVWRLTAPALDATARVRFGGAAVDDYGGWAPVAREGAQFDDGAIVVDVPGASAALVTLQLA